MLNTDTILDSPAAPETWGEVQKVATANAAAYEQAFRYIPRNQAHPDIGSQRGFASIWPTWHYPHDKELTEGKLAYRMPFDPIFWRAPQRADQAHTWNLPTDTLGRAAESAPQGIQGFISALPVAWTGGVENNNSTLSLTVLANNDVPSDGSGRLAARQNVPQEETVG